jgi:hypothetical protein
VHMHWDIVDVAVNVESAQPTEALSLAFQCGLRLLGSFFA